MKKMKNYFVGGLINVAAGLGTAAYGAYQERQAKKKMAQADEAAVGPIRSQAARQRIARQTSDAQAGVDAALRAQATAADQIAAQGGSRALVSATPGLMRATELASNRAIQSVPTLDETSLTAGQNQQARLNLNRLSRAADAARQTTIGGVSQAIQGGAEILGSTAKFKRNKPKPEALELPTTDPSAPKTDALTAMSNAAMQGTQQGLIDFTKQAKADKAASFNILEEEVTDPSGTVLLDEVDVKEDGGVQEPVDKTPGEFSHDDNPIDIVQEGAKIGEMTGGEYIFNPEQAEEMRKLSEEGDTELHEFVRNLLNKEQFK
jgi:hypothetical protein